MNNLDKLQVLYLSKYFFCQLYESAKLPAYIEEVENAKIHLTKKQQFGGSYPKRGNFSIPNSVMKSGFKIKIKSMQEKLYW